MSFGMGCMLTILRSTVYPSSQGAPGDTPIIALPPIWPRDLRTQWYKQMFYESHKGMLTMESIQATNTTGYDGTSAQYVFVHYLHPVIDLLLCNQDLTSTNILLAKKVDKDWLRLDAQTYETCVKILQQEYCPEEYRHSPASDPRALLDVKSHGKQGTEE